MLQRFLEDRPTTDHQANDSDYADRWIRLPPFEPDGNGCDRHQTDAQSLIPIEWVLVVVMIVMIVIMVMILVALIGVPILAMRPVV